jgi:hypothetical protein
MEPLCYDRVKGVPWERAFCDVRKSDESGTREPYHSTPSRTFFIYVTEASLKRADLTLAADMNLRL